MKKTLCVALLMLWPIAVLSAGYGRGKHQAAPQKTQAFVYSLSGQDVGFYRVGKGGKLGAAEDASVDVGQFPRCLAATPNGHTLYVASDADRNDYHSGWIFEFTIRKDGMLTYLGAIEAGSIPFPMVIDPSGSFLYCAAQDGVKQQGLIYQYRIGPDGSLSALKPPLINLGKSFAQSLAVPRSGKYLYAPTEGRPFCFRVSQNGTLSRLPFAPTQVKVKELALSPSGSFAYLLQSGGVISVAKINPLTGHFSSPRPVAHVLPLSYGLSVSVQRNVLQVTNARKTGANGMTDGPVSEFQLLPDGGLKPTAPLAISFPAVYTRLAPNPRGRFVNVVRSR